MTQLIFPNAGLRSLLKYTREAKVFRRSMGGAVQAYEKETGKEWDIKVKLDDKYYETTTPTLFFVKDEGIYLMTAAKGIPRPVEDHVCYAVGYAPNDDDSYDRCRAAVGGDDFGEEFEFTREMQAAVMHGESIVIKWYGDSYEIITTSIHKPKNK